MMVELADTADLKSAAREGIRVRASVIPSPAPMPMLPAGGGIVVAAVHEPIGVAPAAKIALGAARAERAA